MTLGDIIKKYRTEHKINMRDFASLSGLSRAYISMLERNINPTTGKPIAPSIEVIKKVADAMGEEFDSIFNQIDGDVTISPKQDPYFNPSVDTGFENVSTTFFIETSGSMPSLPMDAIPFIPSKTLPIPIVGSINCGTPLFAEDNIEGYIETPVEDMTSDEIYFWLRAKGDSMINAGIHEGDLLLIRQQNDVDSGDIAVVAVNGDEATLKRVVKKENALVLQPENPAHETKIFVGNEINDVQIRGRLMELKKKF